MDEREAPPAPPETTQQRALADERRAKLLEALRQAPDGLDVQELAARLRVHQNTVRWHLGVLADAGLVASRPTKPHGPGRPRVRYVARRDAELAGPDRHRMLASMLAEALAELDDASERAFATGRAWGRDAAAGRARATSPDAEHGYAELVGLLTGQGFAPERDGDAIALRSCPLHDLAEAHPQVVCALHHGLVSGALEELGAPLGVRRLRPFAAPGLCVLECDDR